MGKEDAKKKKRKKSSSSKEGTEVPSEDGGEEANMRKEQRMSVMLKTKEKKSKGKKSKKLKNKQDGAKKTTEKKKVTLSTESIKDLILENQRRVELDKNGGEPQNDKEKLMVKAISDRQLMEFWTSCDNKVYLGEITNDEKWKLIQEEDERLEKEGTTTSIIVSKTGLPPANATANTFFSRLNPYGEDNDDVEYIGQAAKSEAVHFCFRIDKSTVFKYGLIPMKKVNTFGEKVFLGWAIAKVPKGVSEYDMVNRKGGGKGAPFFFSGGTNTLPELRKSLELLRMTFSHIPLPTDLNVVRDLEKDEKGHIDLTVYDSPRYSSSAYRFGAYAVLREDVPRKSENGFISVSDQITFTKLKDKTTRSAGRSTSPPYFMQRVDSTSINRLICAIDVIMTANNISFIAPTAEEIQRSESMREEKIRAMEQQRKHARGYISEYNKLRSVRMRESLAAAGKLDEETEDPIILEMQRTGFLTSGEDGDKNSDKDVQVGSNEDSEDDEEDDEEEDEDTDDDEDDEDDDDEEEEDEEEDDTDDTDDDEDEEEEEEGSQVDDSEIEEENENDKEAEATTTNIDESSNDKTSKKKKIDKKEDKKEDKNSEASKRTRLPSPKRTRSLTKRKSNEEDAAEDDDKKKKKKK